ncbi:MAG: CotH kinase family protein [Porticoccaceae bacterium]|nr:CotH kinase family protein [Porticoccaceae bacterium]
MRRLTRLYLMLFFLLSVGCGSGSNMRDSSPNPLPAAAKAPTSYFIGGSITGLQGRQNILLVLDGQILTTNTNGSFTFDVELETGVDYRVDIVSEPPRTDCQIENASGTLAEQDIDNVQIECSTDASAELFSLDRLHKIRLSMTVDEWRAFELDTIRAKYAGRDANGIGGSLVNTAHSEVYRQVDFAYLDAAGAIIQQVEKVGFKMQGNTSRQYPVDEKSSPQRPRRFSFSIKFDEEFDEDESVYACIDYNGLPKAVAGFPCGMRVAQNIPEYPAADGRKFMDIEKLRFRFNRTDPSYQREVLAHQLLDEMGVPAARATHAQVELVITGTPQQTLFANALPQTYNLGVFNMLEQIDKPFLKLYFGENGYLFKVGAPGNLSEPDVVDTGCTPYEDSEISRNANFCVVGVEKSDPDTALEWLGVENYLNPEFVNADINGDSAPISSSQFFPYQPSYDLKTKKKSLLEARAALVGFAQFLQSRPSANALAERFDVPAFITAQAVEIVIGAVDHYVRVANNYYLFFNESTDKWVYVPTDFDYTLIDVTGPQCKADPSQPVCNQFFNVEAFSDLISTTAFPLDSRPHWAGEFFYNNYPPILWDLIFAEKSYRTSLYAEIERMLRTSFDWSRIQPLLLARKDRLHQAIIATDAADAVDNIGGPDCAQRYNADEIDGASATFCNPSRASIKRFIEGRRETLLDEITRQN